MSDGNGSHLPDRIVTVRARIAELRMGGRPIALDELATLEAAEKALTGEIHASGESGHGSVTHDSPLTLAAGALEKALLDERHAREALKRWRDNAPTSGMQSSVQREAERLQRAVVAATAQREAVSAALQKSLMQGIELINRLRAPAAVSARDGGTALQTKLKAAEDELAGTIEKRTDSLRGEIKGALQDRFAAQAGGKAEDAAQAQARLDRALTEAGQLEILTFLAQAGGSADVARELADRLKALDARISRTADLVTSGQDDGRLSDDLALIATLQAQHDALETILLMRGGREAVLEHLDFLINGKPKDGEVLQIVGHGPDHEPIKGWNEKTKRLPGLLAQASGGRQADTGQTSTAAQVKLTRLRLAWAQRRQMQLVLTDPALTEVQRIQHWIEMQEAVAKYWAQLGDTTGMFVLPGLDIGNKAREQAESIRSELKISEVPALVNQLAQAGIKNPQEFFGLLGQLMREDVVRMWSVYLGYVGTNSWNIGLTHAYRVSLDIVAGKTGFATNEEEVVRQSDEIQALGHAFRAAAGTAFKDLSPKDRGVLRAKGFVTSDDRYIVPKGYAYDPATAADEFAQAGVFDDVTIVSSLELLATVVIPGAGAANLARLIENPIGRLVVEQALFTFFSTGTQVLIDPKKALTLTPEELLEELGGNIVQGAALHGLASATRAAEKRLLGTTIEQLGNKPIQDLTRAEIAQVLVGKGVSAALETTVVATIAALQQGRAVTTDDLLKTGMALLRIKAGAHVVAVGTGGRSITAAGFTAPEEGSLKWTEHIDNAGVREAIKACGDGAATAAQEKVMLDFLRAGEGWKKMSKSFEAANPELAKALCDWRAAVCKTVAEKHGLVMTGGGGSMQNDIDMSALGEDAGKRLHEAKAELAVKIGDRDSEGVIDTSIFMDPTLIHAYDLISDPAMRAEVMKAATKQAEALLAEKLKGYGSDMAAGVGAVTGAQSTGGPGADGHAAVDAKPYLDKIDVALRKIREIRGRDDLTAVQKDQLVKDQASIIVTQQIVLNGMTPGAYMTPGAVKLTVTIKEMIMSQPYKAAKQRAAAMAEGLRNTNLSASERAKFENAWKAAIAEMSALKNEALKGVTADEAYQSILGDIDFFEHMVTEARAEALKQLQRETAGLSPAQAQAEIAKQLEERTLEQTASRYEASKYADRVLEVAEQFGMNPMTAGFGQKWLKLRKYRAKAHEIYKKHDPSSRLDPDNVDLLRDYVRTERELMLEVLAAMKAKVQSGAQVDHQPVQTASQKVPRPAGTKLPGVGLAPGTTGAGASAGTDQAVQYMALAQVQQRIAALKAGAKALEPDELETLAEVEKALAEDIQTGEAGAIPRAASAPTEGVPARTLKDVKEDLDRKVSEMDGVAEELASQKADLRSLQKLKKSGKSSGALGDGSITRDVDRSIAVIEGQIRDSDAELKKKKLEHNALGDEYKTLKGPATAGDGGDSRSRGGLLGALPLGGLAALLFAGGVVATARAGPFAVPASVSRSGSSTIAHPAAGAVSTARVATGFLVTSTVSGLSQVWSYNADGTGGKALTSGTANHYSAVASPDGKKVAYTGEDGGGYAVYLMNIDGTGVTRLTNPPTYAVGAGWSPDGKHITWSMAQTVSGKYQVYLANADGSNPTALTGTTDSNNSGAVFSPDGTKILYVNARITITKGAAGVTTSSQQQQVWIMNADGSGARQVTAGSGDGAPSWIDNQSFLFNRLDAQGKTSVIYKSNLSGAETQLTPTGKYVVEPQVNPDGKTFAATVLNGTALQPAVWRIGGDPATAQGTPIKVAGDGFNLAWISAPKPADAVAGVVGRVTPTAGGGLPWPLAFFAGAVVAAGAGIVSIRRSGGVVAKADDCDCDGLRAALEAARQAKKELEDDIAMQRHEKEGRAADARRHAAAADRIDQNLAAHPATAPDDTRPGLARDERAAAKESSRQEAAWQRVYIDPKLAEIATLDAEIAGLLQKMAACGCAEAGAAATGGAVVPAGGLAVAVAPAAAAGMAPVKAKKAAAKPPRNCNREAAARSKAWDAMAQARARMDAAQVALDAANLATGKAYAEQQRWQAIMDGWGQPGNTPPMKEGSGVKIREIVRTEEVGTRSEPVAPGTLTAASAKDVKDVQGGGRQMSQGECQRALDAATAARQQADAAAKNAQAALDKASAANQAALDAYNTANDAYSSCLASLAP